MQSSQVPAHAIASGAVPLSDISNSRQQPQQLSIDLQQAEGRPFQALQQFTPGQAAVAAAGQTVVVTAAPAERMSAVCMDPAASEFAAVPAVASVDNAVIDRQMIDALDVRTPTVGQQQQQPGSVSDTRSMQQQQQGQQRGRRKKERPNPPRPKRSTHPGVAAVAAAHSQQHQQSDSGHASAPPSQQQQQQQGSDPSSLDHGVQQRTSSNPSAASQQQHGQPQQQQQHVSDASTLGLGIPQHTSSKPTAASQQQHDQPQQQQQQQEQPDRPRAAAAAVTSATAEEVSSGSSSHSAPKQSEQLPQPQPLEQQQDQDQQPQQQQLPQPADDLTVFLSKTAEGRELLKKWQQQQQGTQEFHKQDSQQHHHHHHQQLPSTQAQQQQQQQQQPIQQQTPSEAPQNEAQPQPQQQQQQQQEPGEPAAVTGIPASPADDAWMATAVLPQNAAATTTAANPEGQQEGETPQQQQQHAGVEQAAVIQDTVAATTPPPAAVSSKAAGAAAAVAAADDDMMLDHNNALYSPDPMHDITGGHLLQHDLSPLVLSLLPFAAAAADSDDRDEGLVLPLVQQPAAAAAGAAASQRSSQGALRDGIVHDPASLAQWQQQQELGPREVPANAFGRPNGTAAAATAAAGASNADTPVASAGAAGAESGADPASTRASPASVSPAAAAAAAATPPPAAVHSEYSGEYMYPSPSPTSNTKQARGLQKRPDAGASPVAAAAAAAAGSSGLDQAAQPAHEKELGEDSRSAAGKEAAAAAAAAIQRQQLPDSSADPAAAAAAAAALQAHGNAKDRTHVTPLQQQPEAGTSAAAAAAAGSSNWQAALQAEWDVDHMHPMLETYPGYRLTVMGNQLRYLATHWNLHIPAAVVLRGMAAYAALAKNLASWHVGLESCAYPADLNDLAKSKCWPPGITPPEVNLELEQDPLGHYVIHWTVPDLQCISPTAAAAAATAAAAAGSSNPGSRAKRARSTLDESPSRQDQRQQQQQQSEHQYATFAWPLIIAPQHSAAAAAAAGSSVAHPVYDTVLVALPKGMQCSWDLEVVEAAAAAKAGSSGSSRKLTGFQAILTPNKSRGPKMMSCPRIVAPAARQPKLQAAPPQPWFEVRYAELWQYKPGHRHFAATSWAALWPVFLRKALMMDDTLHPQHRQQLLLHLSDIWHDYQQRLLGYGFPRGDGSDILAAAAALGQSSRETSPSPTAAASAGGNGSAVGTEVLQALTAAFPSSRGRPWAAGLKRYLHTIYLHQGQPRSPYDLARDDDLWLQGAYESLDDALDNVQVDDADLDRAIAAMSSSKERTEARAKLLGQGKVCSKRSKRE